MSLSCGDRTLVCAEAEPGDRELVTETSDVEPGTYVTLGVDCPDDTQLVTGGCVAGGYHDSMTIVASVPEDSVGDGSGNARSWACTVWLADDASPGVVQAWALCEDAL